ncbi:MAG TPA: HEPN domain-containing protein [Bacillales bacterium]|nr:HEPN domain-containing protein [Bacillales bacterium]
MNKKERISYWRDTAEKDYETMRHLYKNKDFPWSLFVGYVVVEKLLKVIFVQRVAINPPDEHDLCRLAKKSKLELSDEHEELLNALTGFYINIRYPDHKDHFYQKCTEEFTQSYLKKVKEMKSWLIGEMDEA